MTSGYHEVHSVSDLHLGGEPGRQIFAGTAEMVAFVSDLAQRAQPRRVAFVVNGDVFDFLAEPNAVAFDPNAVTKLRRILQDQSFAPIVAAWSQLLKRPNSALVLVLGNHDLEMAMHDVRAELVAALAGDDAAAAGRLIFCTDGAGFATSVGDASVLCIHGNDFDSWNATDYERLRCLARDRQFGLPVDGWTPNAGSKMVVDVMNDIKRSLPFVDLLKPETEAVVPLLLAFDQGSYARLRGAAAVSAKLAWDKARRTFGFLGGDDEDDDVPRSDPLVGILERALQGSSLRSGSPGGSRLLLQEAEEWLRAGMDPMDLLEGDGSLGITDWVAAGWRRLFGGDLSEALRRGLQPLAHDRSFAIDDVDDTFRQVDTMVAGEVRYLIAGHTHLARSLPRRNGGGHYFNTGTWARLIQVKPEQLEDPAEFKSLLANLRLPTLAALDGVEGLVLRRPCVASVWQEDQRVRGALRHVGLANGKMQLTDLGDAP